MQTRDVALIVETSTSWGAQIVRGVADFARDHADWAFHLEPHGVYERLQLPRNWRGDGIIARVTTRQLAEQIIESGCPAVNVSWYSFDNGRIPCCTTDEMEVGRLAAGHFLERGFRHFAYRGPIGRPNYVDVVGRAFEETLGATHHRACRFRPTSQRGSRGWAALREDLGNWLVALPKPIGLFAFDSVGGRQITEACRVRAIAVPDEVAVLCGDRDELFTSVSQPLLSSIDLSPWRVGQEAAALLERLMAGETAPEEPVLVPSAGVLVQHSTDTLAVDDPILLDAIQYIGKHACQGIGVNDLLQALPVSRRALEQRFSRILGRTIAAEIRRVRIEKAKQMLMTTSHTICQIASDCGFEHAEVLSRVFRREVRYSPSAYRKQTQQPTQTRSIL